MYYGSGQGKPEKSTGPPKPASASRRLIITAIAASSLPSDGTGFGDSLIVVPPIISITSLVKKVVSCPSSGDAPKSGWMLCYTQRSIQKCPRGVAVNAIIRTITLC